jgi:TonB family protein
MAMRRLLSLAAGLLLLSGSATFAQSGAQAPEGAQSGAQAPEGAQSGAQAPEGGKADVDTPVSWLKQPNGNDLNAVWPKKASETGASGTARIRCVVTVAGLLSACKVVSETPADYGFGAAAILLSPSFLFKPATHNGAPVVSFVTIPINFANNGSPVAAGGPTIHVTSWYPWIKAPTAADVRAAYPVEAAAKAPHGHVVIRCGFRPDTRLKSCEAVAESPLGLGFARSAMALSKQFQGLPGVLAPRELDTTYVNLAIDFQPPTNQTRYIDEPDWTRTLNPAHAAALFPGKAVDAKRLKGQAIVDCAIDEAGGLTQCQVASEAPAGLDFGRSAITAAQAMRVNLWTRDGAPTPGAHIRLPITLVYAGDNPDPEAAPNSAPNANKPQAKPARAS